jgi:hypothetical protein
MHLNHRKPNWYCIKFPRSEDPTSDRIKALFPPMVVIISTREDIFYFVVMKFGLMGIIRNKLLPSKISWEDFWKIFSYMVN